MPDQNKDLHGNAPDKSAVALLLIDVSNDLEFDGGEIILPPALAMAKNLAALKQKAKHLKIPVIYINDNFGKWQADFQRQLAHCLEDGVCGQPLAEMLRPDDDDYFVLKPKHSGFYSTTLDTLLRYVAVRTLILTGLTGDSCVLFTASDAYMRDFHLIVPADCVASADEAENDHALRHRQRVLKADVRLSTELNLKHLMARR